MPDQAPRSTHYRARPRPGRRIDLTYELRDAAPSERGARAAHTLNIGVGGAFVVTADPPPAGTSLTVHLQLPTGKPIAIRAEVRWIQDGDEDRVHGMGLQFRGLEGVELRALNEYFAQLAPVAGAGEGS